MNPDLALAIGSAPEASRAGLTALWALDDALGKVLATGREPMISRIRLAWWREALERLDREPPPQEPVLEAAARHLLPLRLTGSALAEMEEGWGAALTQELITAGELDLYAAKRGRLLFRFAAATLSAPPPAPAAGELWALVDLARHSSERSDIDAALAAARARIEQLPRRWPRPLRPLGMLSVAAVRDLERGPERWEQPGAPPRTARMLRHRLSGW